MSLIQNVIQLVRERGEATVDDLLPELPGYSREQVFSALHQACYYKRLQIVRMGARRGRLRGGGSMPSTYGPVDCSPAEDENAPLPTRTGPRGEFGIPRVSSVWDLGRQAA